jgi:hypothetical protein
LTAKNIRTLQINCSCRFRHQQGEQQHPRHRLHRAESDPASDGDTVEGSPPRRKMSAPRLGHRRQGLLQEPSPSRWPNRSLRSLGRPSPRDTSPAHGLGSPTPGLVPPVDDPTRLRPQLLCLLGLGSPRLLGRRSLLFEPSLPLSMLTPLPPAPAHRRAVKGFFN